MIEAATPKLTKLWHIQYFLKSFGLITPHPMSLGEPSENEFSGEQGKHNTSYLYTRNQSSKRKLSIIFLKLQNLLWPPNSNLHTVQKQFLSDLGPIVALESLALSKFLASLILVIERLLIAWRRVDYSYATILSIKNILDTACCFK